MSLSIIDTAKIFINTLVRILPVGLYTGSAMSGAVFQDFRGLILFGGFIYYMAQQKIIGKLRFKKDDNGPI